MSARDEFNLTVTANCSVDSDTVTKHFKVVVSVCLFVLFDLILNVPSTIFQLNRDGSSRVEPILSKDKCVLLKDHNAVTPVRLEPAAPRSRVKHSTTEPLRSPVVSVKSLYEYRTKIS